jgi:exodeoxyribonuclease III
VGKAVWQTKPFTGLFRVWSVDDDGTELVRLEPGSLRVITRVSLPSPRRVAVAEDAAWVAAADVLVKIDVTRNVVAASVPLGFEPAAVAVDDEGVWTAGARRVARVDPYGRLCWSATTTSPRVSSRSSYCSPSAASVDAVRIATWNVNSIKQRLPRLLPWLDERRPDVVCLQETKLADDAFAELLGDELAARGYEVAAHGEATWNGVAILSKVGLDDVVTGLAGAPGFPHPEARAVAATCDGVRVVSVYVPNGRVPDSEHYQYKLAWLAALRDVVAAGPEATIVCGDMNIAPTDDDVFDPDAYVGQTHVTAPERAALAELQALGLRDVVRDRWPNERVFTYWDYRAGMFHQDLGMRIDLVLASEPVAGRVQAAWVDRQARKGSGPSDHAPVIVDLDEAPDGDIGPVVPPPSAPVTRRGAKKLPQAP